MLLFSLGSWLAGSYIQLAKPVPSEINEVSLHHLDLRLSDVDPPSNSLFAVQVGGWQPARA
jgi:hypothetical protein